jgi:cold shock CspA family protein
MSSSKDSDTSQMERLIGRVKWFNNKAGYGFVTVTDGAQSGSDIFSHHSCINVSNQQYKYLVQGEYVEFTISPTQNSTHAFQASNISGIKGGKLMCETRNDFKSARTTYNTSSQTESPLNEISDDSWKLASKSKPFVEKETVKQPTTTLAGRGAGRGSGRGAGRGSGRGSGRGAGAGAIKAV